MIDLSPENAAAIDRVLEFRSVSPSYHASQAELAELFVGRTSASGAIVNEQTALTYAAVWRAVTLIAQASAGLPMHVYRNRVGPDGRETRETLINHPAEWLLNVEANDELDAYTLRECMTMHALTWGNAAAEVVRRGDGVPLALELLLPWNFSPVRALDGRLFYHITRDDGSHDYVHSSNILSIIGPSPDGIWGYSPIRLARESIGVGLAAERFGASFFGRGARPGGVLEHPANLSADAIARLQRSFDDQHAGSHNAGKTLVLEEGMKFNPLLIAPQEAQFLESRQFQISEIARWFGVPPHMLFDLTKSTFNNIEEQ
ncbi:MAG TPA: phage portal protein, partial [Pirellulales bacterium]